MNIYLNTHLFINKMKLSTLLLFTTLSIITISTINSSYPVAIFHGLGDSCLINPGMYSFSGKIGKPLGVYAKCIETGGGPLDWITSFRHQAHKACENLKKDGNFDGDFSVIGLSQGSLIARYIIESCDMKGRVKRYISIGGPQMGVGSFPQCTGGAICKVVDKVVDTFVYFKLIQSVIGPAGYFKDINNYESYLQYSTFLSDLNNEKDEKNNEYKKRMEDLEKVVLIKFTEDTMIIPRETAWFEFYESGNGKEVVPLEESRFYKEDYIGVRKLNEEGRINFVGVKGNHLQFSDDDITNYMIPALR